MPAALWLLVSYLAGGIPWSVWLGKLFYHTDPRQQPDRNPGAANAFRAAGWRLGLLVLLLDFAKAFVPVAVARWLAGVPTLTLFWIALLPTLGHAFSPFLRFRGGRGIVVMFGVWAALTLYQVPIMLGLTACASLFIFMRDEWRALVIPLVLIVYLLLTRAPTWMVMLACAELLVLIAKIGVFVYEQRKRARLEAPHPPEP